MSSSSSRPLTWSGIVAAFCFGACDAVAPYSCTYRAEPAIVVEILDSVSGAPLAALATGVVRDGAFSDFLRPYAFHGSSDASMYSRKAAEERAGRYDVEVRLDGYRTWSASRVHVTEGPCHVNTQTLSARLQRFQSP